MPMPHEIHYPILEQLGLNASEAIVFELLLEFGPKPANELVEPSGLGRGNVYNALTSLKQKGLILEESGKKTIFSVVNPEQLRVFAKSRVNAAQELYNQLESSLPGLKSQYQLITKRPTFRVFEGVSGLKEMYVETLRVGKPIYALVGPDVPDPALYEWLTTSYVKSRVEQGIHAHVLVSGAGEQTEEYKKKSAAEARTVVFVDPVTFPFYGEVDVFGDNVSFISYKSDELIGFMIESSALATTIRSTIQVAMQTSTTPPSSAPHEGPPPFSAE